MNNSANSRVKSLAVSLSGGGHRATLFVACALMYLVDAKYNAHSPRLHLFRAVSDNGLWPSSQFQGDRWPGISGSALASPLATQIAKSGTLFAPLFTKSTCWCCCLGALTCFADSGDRLSPWYVRLLLFFVGLRGWAFRRAGSAVLRARQILCSHPTVVKQL